MLANGNTTIEGNAEAPDIISNVSFSLPSVSFTLTLEAQGNLTINHVIRNPGPGSINLIYNANGAGGMLSFGPKGKLTFGSTSTPLSINGQAYTLVANIATLARLIQDNPSGSFALAANYNAKHDGTYSQSPILTPFAGIFEGLGNTITNLVVEDQNQNSQGTGLFYQLNNTAVLATLNVKYAVINGEEVAGGLVADNQGTLLFDSFAGDVGVGANGNCTAGDLAGINDGTIEYSTASGPVTDVSACFSSSLGGLVGVNGSTNASAAVASSNASGTATSVVSNSWVGGLVGSNFASIAGSYASGAVAGGAQIGALVGQNFRSISNSSATGSASGGDGSAVGGFVGFNNGSVDTCQAGTATDGQTVSGGTGSYVGGAFGSTGYAYVSNCTSYGAVSGGTGSSVGGFIGYDGSANSGYYSNDQWDITTSGNKCAAGNACTDSGITGFN